MRYNRIQQEVLLLTAVLTAYVLCLHTPLPYLNLMVFESLPGFFSTLSGSTPGTPFSIIALGIMPYVSASLLIEIGALFLPFLKKHRQGDYQGRKRLKMYSLFLTAIFAILQGWFVTEGITGIEGIDGEQILVAQSFVKKAVITATLAGAVFLLILATEILSLYSIANGVSLLLLAGFCLDLSTGFNHFFIGSAALELNFFHFLLFILVAFILLLLVPIFLFATSSPIALRHHTDTAPSHHFHLNGCLPGKTAIPLASSLVMLPATVASFLGMNLPMPFYNSDSVFHRIATVIALMLMSYLLGWLFLNPAKRIQKLQGWGWYPVDSPDDFLLQCRKRFNWLIIPWTIFLCVTSILSTLAVPFFSTPFILGGASIVVMAAIGVDIVNRLDFHRQHGDIPMLMVAEYHDVHDAVMIKTHLASEGIAFHLQGFYHRHLLYFFGPYIPIRLLVSADDRKRCTTLLKRYYGGLGLVPPSQ